MNASEIANVAQAVNRWLAYQIICGREPLLSEAYLGHPVAEYLIHKHSGTFEAEVDHPAFAHVGRGRPRQIDYVLRTPNSGVIDVAIECKWIADRPYDKQRILNDILRLECVRVPGHHVKRFLLVAGREDHFKAHFQNLKLNDTGAQIPFTSHYLPFSFKDNDRTVALRNCLPRYRAALRVFADAFGSPIPHSLKTTLLERRVTDEIRVCIWQIGSIQNRQPFAPSVEWGPENDD